MRKVTQNEYVKWFMHRLSQVIFCMLYFKVSGEKLLLKSCLIIALLCLSSLQAQVLEKRTEKQDENHMTKRSWSILWSLKMLVFFQDYNSTVYVVDGLEPETINNFLDRKQDYQWLQQYCYSTITIKVSNSTVTVQ